VDGAHGTLTEQELEAAHCWEPGDLVPGRPAMTDYRRALRYHQARWRDARLLTDESTFSSVTLEELLDAKALPAETTTALRDRYLPRQA
jgi:hypothetical protein